MKASDIANFTKTNYGQLASHARGLIVKDMNDGVMQNGIKKYKSKDYAAKKATGALGKFRKSDRVTMLLSGETARRIRPEGKKDRATLVYENGTIVQANEDRGYVIADLSPKNRDKSALFLQRIVDRNVKKYESKPIKIKIGK
jgi:hypothetical protein|tara:strand:- start:304 stop:732 length:429 start_codon:yes stop_codon:yes gene_type:complete